MRTRLNVVALIAIAGLLPLPALAQHYNYVEGGYVSVDNDADDDAGFRFAGSLDVAEPLAVFGEYLDTGNFEQMTAGALFHTPLSPVLDFTAGASLESIDAGRADDEGFGLRAGLRWQLSPQRVELAPELRHLDIFDETFTSLRLGVLVSIAPELEVQGALQSGDDDRFELGLRYNFGPPSAGAPRRRG